QRVAFALDRAKMLAQIAQEVHESQGPAKVRQQSDLSSFAMPDLPIDSPRWTERDGSFRREKFHRQALRDERRAMERHARGAGCSLIVDDTFVAASGEMARRARIEILVDFLDSMSDGCIEIAIGRRSAHDPSSVVIVGDWCSATSV